MAAASTDKFKKGTNNFSTTLSAGIGSTDTTISLSSTTNLPTDTGIVLVIDRVDANGNKTPAAREYVKGVVSGTTLINVVRGVGNSTAGSHSIGAVVEYVFDQTTLNDMVDGITQDHDQSGHHKSLTDTNGKTWIGQTATANAVNYLNVSNAVAGGDVALAPTGSDANVNLSLQGKGTGQVLIAHSRQDNGVNSVETGAKVVTGWGFITGTGAAFASKTITFPITFTGKPTVTVSCIGYKDSSDPTNIGDFSYWELPAVNCAAITTSGLTIGFRTIDGSAVASTRRIGFTFTATGA